MRSSVRSASGHAPRASRSWRPSTSSRDREWEQARARALERATPDRRDHVERVWDEARDELDVERQREADRELERVQREVE